MKQTNINIDEIKRYPTVTNPIKADDLNTPQAYAYTLRRAIVTDCTREQRAELVELLDGKDTAEGVTFNNTRVNRDRLHIWQNEQSRHQRAAILGEGWEYVSGLHHHTKPGDLVTCLDGTRGRVTKASEESCVIEFETEDGRRLSVAGYFRKSGQFFTTGTRYRCTRTVINDKGRETFTKGQIYEQASDPTIYYGWLRNNSGTRHAWPQPQEIANECEAFDLIPADIDPRNYFEPVSE